MTAPEILKSYVERVERMDEEIKSLNDDKRDIYAEAKSNGFDVPALKKVIARRRLDPDKRAELDSMIETYEAELGTGNALARAHVHEAERPAPIKTRPDDYPDLPAELDRRVQA